MRYIIVSVKVRVRQYIIFERQEASKCPILGVDKYPILYVYECHPILDANKYPNLEDSLKNIHFWMFRNFIQFWKTRNIGWLSMSSTFGC